MIFAHLLSTSSYHVALTPSGGGHSRWRSLASSRWGEDAAPKDNGFRIFLREKPPAGMARGDGDFGNKVLSAMRHSFGGHVEVPAGGKS